jgi:hypothetical protein
MPSLRSGRGADWGMLKGSLKYTKLQMVWIYGVVGESILIKKIYSFTEGIWCARIREYGKDIRTLP